MGLRMSEEEYADYLNRQKKTAPKEKMAKRPAVNKEYPQNAEILPPKKNKYNNKPTTVHDITFDSKKEAEYYEKLLDLQCHYDEVADIKLQVAYELQPGYMKNGKKIRPITYVADFVVTYTDGHVEIVDTKGFRTKDYKIKKKIFEYKFPDLTIKEV